MKWSLYWSDVKAVNTRYDFRWHRMLGGTIVLHHHEWQPKASYVLPAKWTGTVRKRVRLPIVPERRTPSIFDDLTAAFK